jgi:hypothetical protein
MSSVRGIVVGLSLIALGCGGPTAVVSRPPAEIPKVEIQVAVPTTFKGFPLTITAEPLPAPIDKTVFGTEPNQYSFVLDQEALQYGSFQLLSVDPNKHQGTIIGTINLATELLHFDLKSHGDPTLVAFLVSPGASPTVAPHLTRAIVQWWDGQQDQFNYN